METSILMTKPVRRIRRKKYYKVLRVRPTLFMFALVITFAIVSSIRLALRTDTPNNFAEEIEIKYIQLYDIQSIQEDVCENAAYEVAIQSESIPIMETLAEGVIIDFSDYNDAGYSQYVTYMGWQLITCTASPQWKLMESIKQSYGTLPFDDNGIGFVDGRYAIAVTNNEELYPDPIAGGMSNGLACIGDYVNIHLADGTVIECIVADVKSTADAFSCYGHTSGKSTSIVEFVVDRDVFYVRNAGENNSLLRQIMYGCSSNSDIVYDYIEIVGNYFD